MRQKVYLALSLVVLAFLSSQLAWSQEYVPGNSYFGRNNYIEYIAGNLPLIISAPHGGDLVPDEIPDRTCGTETVTDSYTMQLASEIGEAINELTGCYPHIIICHLKRTKLDANRDIDEAACGNEFAEQAWNEFHNFIGDAKTEVVEESGKGLYIDLHGHGHAIQRLEIGYLLTSTDLRYPDATLNTTVFQDRSSIRNLVYSNESGIAFSDLLRGMTSLGSLFEIKGYPAVPGIDDPYPLVGQTYFSGGYNTERHGSVENGTIDGIQVECNQDVRFVEQARKDFADAFAAVLLDYLIDHYFPDLPSTYILNGDNNLADQSLVKVYPNPFSNLLYINCQVPATLRIFNLQGEIVRSQDIAEGSLTIGDLPEGIYIVTLSTGREVIYRGKIIRVNRN